MGFVMCFLVSPVPDLLNCLISKRSQERDHWTHHVDLEGLIFGTFPTRLLRSQPHFLSASLFPSQSYSLTGPKDCSSLDVVVPGQHGSRMHAVRIRTLRNVDGDNASNRRSRERCTSGRCPFTILVVMDFDIVSDSIYREVRSLSSAFAL
jgi:hypothetical protein